MHNMRCRGAGSGFWAGSSYSVRFHMTFQQAQLITQTGREKYMISTSFRKEKLFLPFCPAAAEHNRVTRSCLFVTEWPPRPRIQTLASAAWGWKVVHFALQDRCFVPSQISMFAITPQGKSTEGLQSPVCSSKYRPCIFDKESGNSLSD